MTVPAMLHSTNTTASAPAITAFRGSITHPTQQLCTLRGRRCRRLTQHSPPGGSLRLTWAGLSPADRASLLAPSVFRRVTSAVARERRNTPEDGLIPPDACDRVHSLLARPMQGCSF